MINKLTEKDIRALKIGAIGAVVILVFVLGSEWRERWAAAKTKGAALQTKLNVIDVDKIKQSGLASIVPVFEMPKAEDEQTFLFRDKLSEQFKKAGIKNKPLQAQTNRKSPHPDYNLLLVKCSAKCRFSQVLDFIARLNENPYLVGIEEFKIKKSDPKKPQDVEFDLTVSTFVSLSKKGGGS
ncbi:hypothetical protein ACFL5Z_13765 [Planctomycetota bacterium]